MVAPSSLVRWCRLLVVATALSSHSFVLAQQTDPSATSPPKSVPNANPRPRANSSPEPRHTARVGGNRGGAFTERAEEGRLLTGFSVVTADYAGHDVIGSIQALFQGPGGVVKGLQHGIRGFRRTLFEAAPGYAVGAINILGSDRVDGLSVVFMRVKPSGSELDAEDSYTSDWIGRKDGSSEQVRLGSGRPVIGLFGASGAELDSLGLLETDTIGSPTSPVGPAKAAFKHAKAINVENGATLQVVNLKGEPLVEAANAKEGRWRKVAPALEGATIFAKADGKANGVAEFTATTAGRVYLACNYAYQGNRSGNWTETRWDAEAFQQNGWTLVDGVELTSWENQVYIIFTKELKAGETARLRCNKYEPPYFITFAK